VKIHTHAGNNVIAVADRASKQGVALTGRNTTQTTGPPSRAAPGELRCMQVLQTTTDARDRY